LPGHTKVTREDWLTVARDTAGLATAWSEVKILALGPRMGVSRSSFYWYFKAARPARPAAGGMGGAQHRHHHGAMRAAGPDITEAVCNFFRCFHRSRGFDQRAGFRRARMVAARRARCARIDDAGRQPPAFPP
jgi:hypothetical protein